MNQRQFVDFLIWINEGWRQGESDIAVMKEEKLSLMSDPRLVLVRNHDIISLVGRYLEGAEKDGE